MARTDPLGLPLASLHFATKRRRIHVGRRRDDHVATKPAVASLLAGSFCALAMFANSADAQVSYQRDSQGRTSGWTEPQGRNAEFELTPDGQIAKAKASGGFQAIQSFDATGRVIAIEQRQRRHAPRL